MSRSILLGTLIALSVGAGRVLAAAPADAMNLQPAPFDAEHWALSGDAAFTNYRDQHVLRLKEGLADLKAVKLETGTVSFDVIFPGEPNFPGLRFRIADSGNYEYVYLRTDRSDRPDAEQYTPVFHGDSGWQIYSGPGFNATETFKVEAWNHVEIRIYPDSADVFVNGQRSLRIPDLKRGPGEGGLALAASPGFYALTGQVLFANFKYKAEALARPADMPAPVKFDPPGLVRHWQVSAPLGEEELKPGAPPVGGWTDLKVETNGLANLARVSGRTKARPNVIAKFEVNAEKAGTRLMRFGYSDKVAIQVNGQPVFKGEATFLLRDSYFQGTAGFHDAVAVPLKRGRNEIAFVVNEEYGGWAAGAQFEDPAGLSGAALAPN